MRTTGFSRGSRSGLQALAFTVVAAFVSLGTASVGATTSVTPDADTYVDASSTSAKGTRTYLTVDSSPERVAYLRFNVTGYASGDKVLLRVRALSSHSIGFQVHTVADTAWSESVTYPNRPSYDAASIGNSGPLQSGSDFTVDVSQAVTGNGLVSFALTTTSSTSMKIASRESATAPLLVVGAVQATTFTVSQTGSSYQAVSAATTFTGSLKSVVENAARELSSTGGGTVIFGLGTFDLGPDWWEFKNLTDVAFVGQGIDQTVIRNYSSASTDTEPFDTSNLLRVSVRDLTVHAGGPYRSTSDALDFDRGNGVVVERVKVTGARGRGIVFDGKELLGLARSDDNVIRDCIVTGVPSDGIELLAARNNLVENCTVTSVGGHGIQMTKASPSADQPNKLSSNNIIRNNTVDRAGQDGVNINGGNENQISGNTIINSSTVTSNRSGIHVGSSDSQPCNGNVIESNSATDTRTPKLQRYGLKIVGSNCVGTVVRGNDFSGNLTAPISDTGAGTIYL